MLPPIALDTAFVLLTIFLVSMWCLAIVLAVYFLVPPLAHGLGLCLYRSVIENDPPEVVFRGDDVPPDVYPRLEALGFRPLGNHWETVWFLSKRWRWLSRSRVFGSSAHRCFASLYYFPGIGPLRIAFITCFENDDLLATRNYGTGQVVAQRGYTIGGYDSEDLAGLLASHRQALAEQELQTRVDHEDIRVLQAAKRKHSPRILRVINRGSLLLFGTRLAALGLPPVFLLMTSGYDSWTIPLGLTAAGLALLCVEGLNL